MAAGPRMGDPSNAPLKGIHMSAVSRNFSVLGRGPVLLAGVLALLAAPVAAHPGMGNCGPGFMRPATLGVQGEARAYIAPDLATVSLGVTTQAETAAQAMSDNAARQGAIIEALRAQGIAAEDLQTRGLNLSPLQDYSREGQPPRITGYQAQNIVTARVRDIAQLGTMLDALVEAGATDVQGISFSREDASAAEDQARTDAVAEARRRAEVMALAAGMQLGPLRSLSDASRIDSPRPMGMMAARASADAQSTPIEAGQLTITATVEAIWTLLPEGAEAANCDGPGMRHKMPHGAPGRAPAPAPQPDQDPQPETAPDAPAAPAN